MNRLTILKTAGLVAVALSLTQATAQSRVKAENGMARITSAFEIAHSQAPDSAARGDEAAMACTSVMFLDWARLYDPALAQLTPAERGGREFDEFAQLRADVTADFDNMYEVFRPGLSMAIRTVIAKFETDKRLPGKPQQLTLEDIQEKAFSQYLDACISSDELIREVAKIAPPATNPDNLVTRTVTVQVADGGSSGATSFYVPTHAEARTISLKYQDWIDAIKYRGLR